MTPLDFPLPLLATFPSRTSHCSVVIAWISPAIWSSLYIGGVSFLDVVTVRPPCWIKSGISGSGILDEITKVGFREGSFPKGKSVT